MSIIIIPTVGAITSTTSGDATIVSQLVEDCRAMIYGGKRDRLNKLDDALAGTLGDTTVTLQYETQFSDGVRLAVGLEEFYVWTDGPIQVERAWGGSKLEAHNAGDLVYIDPWVSTSEIFRAMNFVLDRLSSPRNGLYAVKTVDLTFDATVRGYDLVGVSDILGDPLEVQWRPVGTTSYDTLDLDDWEVSRQEPTATFPSGNALFIRRGIDHGAPVRLTYSAPFGKLQSLSDSVVAITGLRPSALDLLVYGAAVQLTAAGEVSRNFDSSQGDPRRADEVPAGAKQASGTVLRKIFNDRIQEEASRLADDFPAVKKVWS